MQSAIDRSTQTISYGRTNARAWLIGLLIAEIVSVIAPVGILSTYFRFPAILREPASIALPLFAANQSMIIPAYYVFMLSGLLYLPLSVLLRRQIGASASRIGADLLVVLGAATALFQAIGFSRWLFAVPYLSQAYEQATGNESLQSSIGLLYDFMNRYVGMTIGEHLGFLAMGSWTICLALLLPKQGFSRWFSVAGAVTGTLLVVSIGEHVNTSLTSLFGLINFLANTVWSVWVLILTIQLARQTQLSISTVHNRNL